MIRYAARAVPWGLLGAGAGLVIGLLLLVERWPYTLWPLQGAAVGLLAGTAVWCFNEPAASLVDTMPRSLRWRTTARSTGTLALVAIWLIALQQTRSGYFGHAEDVAWQGIALAAAASAYMTWQRCRGSTGPARALSAGIVGITLFVALARPFDEVLPIFPYTAGDDWATSRLIWAAVPTAVLLLTARLPVFHRLT
ncbi:hypothetical protein EV643_10479 [Kribbella sp. VKM Ac-2527]|uniref:Uncharacterized protein n=1 Tax=Kribbella caucasensis TaxID=2512215 RepID=A0A4R6KLC4_9ACTN|nr:hypothetical protein [Kribbella sp. VKM Ac-2527]TDO50586.1 hypothetical protein EV643_10479 [Kribbella sp. VKM Ac-2527]